MSAKVLRQLYIEQIRSVVNTWEFPISREIAFSLKKTGETEFWTHLAITKNFNDDAISYQIGKTCRIEKELNTTIRALVLHFSKKNAHLQTLNSALADMDAISLNIKPHFNNKHINPDLTRLVDDFLRIQVLSPSAQNYNIH